MHISSHETSNQWHLFEREYKKNSYKYLESSTVEKSLYLNVWYMKIRTNAYQMIPEAY